MTCARQSSGSPLSGRSSHAADRGQIGRPVDVEGCGRQLDRDGSPLRVAQEVARPAVAVQAPQLAEHPAGQDRGWSQHAPEAGRHDRARVGPPCRLQELEIGGTDRGLIGEEDPAASVGSRRR
jgi:hypothetical protein